MRNQKKWLPVEHEREDTAAPIDAVTELLFRFQMLDPCRLEEKRKIIRAKIDEHLRKFGGIKPQNNYGDISKKVDLVCQTALPKLQKVEALRPLASIQEICVWGNVQYLHRNELENPLDFEACWLTNISRLLPECNEIMDVLPYLLTCYLIKAKQNRIDPFSYIEENSYTKFAGWAAIFQDRIKDRETTIKNAQADGSSSRKKAIDGIINHFVLPPNCKCNAFLYENGYLLYQSASHRKRDKQAKPVSASIAQRYCLYQN